VSAHSSRPRGETIAATLREHDLKRSASWLLYAIVLTVVAFFVWAATFHVDTVTRAQGRVIPSGRIQVIQSLEGGVVQAIHVKQGQKVADGVALVSLSSIQADGDYQSRRQQRFALLARVARLRAELTETAPSFGSELERDAREFVSIERAAWRARAEERDAQIRVLDSQREQRSREIEETRIVIQTAERTLALAREERRILAQLVARGLEPQIELVRLDRMMADAEGRLDSARSAIVRLEAALAEVVARKDATLRQIRSQAQADLNQVTAELRSLEEVMPALADRVGRTELRSPVNGILNRLLISTIGGVVRSGEPVAEVVPIDDQLVFEAMILPQDIGFVRVGQTARLKISAYDFSIFGAMVGTVTQVSPDVVTNDRGESFYLARIETLSPVLQAGDKELPVLPGMQAQIDIITGAKTVLQYLSKPVVAVRENAFRER
jgi:adhesin transport system membrane fusion protein